MSDATTTGQHSTDTTATILAFPAPAAAPHLHEWVLRHEECRRMAGSIVVQRGWRCGCRASKVEVVTAPEVPAQQTTVSAG